MSFLPKYVPQDRLKYLIPKSDKHPDGYAYTGEDHSILKKLFLGKYWDLAVLIFPSWVAPNLITLLGFFCLFANYMAAFVLCPSVIGCEEPPRWLAFMTAINLFIYQTFDNVDGKQARRTGSSSALGELFDHGVDSLFLLFTGMPFFAGLKVPKVTQFWYLTSGLVGFFSTHWEEYHTGKLIMGVVANPTEIQCVLMGVFVLAGMFGPEFFAQPWSALLPAPVVKLAEPFTDIVHWELKYIFLLAVWVGIAFTLVDLSISIMRVLGERKESFIKPLLRGSVQATHFFLMWLWMRNSKYNVIENQTHMFLTLHGMLFSFYCDQILIARICRMEFPWYNPINIFPLVGALNVTLFEKPLIDEHYALPIIFGVFMLVYVHFILSVIQQFTSTLNINVFTIKPKQG